MKRIISILSLLSCTAFADLSQNVDASTIGSTILPAEAILEATHKIKPQTGPVYFVEGTLNCQELPPIHGGARPQYCEVEVNGRAAQVNAPHEIIKTLQIYVPQNPHASYWTFSGRFKAYSIAREIPPYGTDSEAEVFFN